MKNSSTGKSPKLGKYILCTFEGDVTVAYILTIVDTI